jgi:hypothetical protein
MNDKPTSTAHELPLDPAAMLFSGVVSIALLHSLRAQHTAAQELEELVANQIPPTPLPPLTLPPSEHAPARPWGVTDRPKRINWDFCYRLKWRTWPVDQKRIVPSAASRSQYLRVGTVIFPLWGEELDKVGASFQKLRWIAAPEDASERCLRYQRVVRGEPVDLRQPPSPPPLDENLVRAAEEELSRIAGRAIRVPREDLDAGMEEPSKGRRKRGRPRTRGGRRDAAERLRAAR